MNDPPRGIFSVRTLQSYFGDYITHSFVCTGKVCVCIITSFPYRETLSAAKTAAVLASSSATSRGAESFWRSSILVINYFPGHFDFLYIQHTHRDNGPVEGWLKKCRFELFICTVLKHTGLTNTKKKKTKHKKQQTTNNNAT
jgi:hypothetical protein